MIPLRDTIRTRTVPFVTRLLVVANVAAFVLEFLQGENLDAFLETFAFIPLRFFHPELVGWTLSAAVVTIFTAMFLHGGLAQLLGNMLFLWIFGDNVEDALGHFRFLVFYLVAGLCATLLQAFLSPSSTIPNLGASGAIAGVLGAYLVYYPRARIVTVVPLFILFPVVELPAGVYLLGWFALQFWMGSEQLTRAGRAAASHGGVAFWAHVGGFVVGVAWALIFRPARRPHPAYRIS
ncbi:MAG TPA: rhomboid family intramembrane serine protease [Thermoanaerobaculia bacterium]|nr:rhomboid family intramembrane serine protease [Thermoanaerobaculia bacterium]